MYKHLFKYSVFVITILTANLLTNVFSDYLVDYKNNYKPLTFTLVAMGIIVVVFYPLFSKMEDWVNSLSKHMIKSGKSFGGKYLGLFLIFFTSLFILMFFYAHMWYHINIVKLIFNGSIFNYF